MRRATRSAAFCCLLIMAILAMHVLANGVVTLCTPAWAQDAEPAAADPAADPAPAAPAEDELVLEKPAAGDESGAADADGAPPVEKSYLQWLFESLGIGYSVVFFALSFTLVALVVMNMLAARRDALIPMSLVEGFEGLLNEQKYQEAYEMAKADESMLGQVLSAGLAKLSRGYGPAIESMQETGEEENMKLEHRLSYMALIGTVSPMIGLLGTVQGMIASFQVIATSTTTPKPSKIAEGVATALFTTLVGLMIAIPAIAAYNILRNRFARLVLEVGILSEDLMSRFSNVGEKK